MELRGAHVLVTGSSRGLGRLLAEGFAGAGATVSLVARSGDAIDPLAERLIGHAVVADLTDETDLEGLVGRVEAGAGRPVDVLVNNAGIEQAGMLELAAEADIERTVRLNLTVPLRLCRQVLPGMVERDTGHIVQISSASAVVPMAGLTTYGATKAGLTQASRALRQELRGTGIGLTVATLGPIRSEMWDRVGADPAAAAVSGRLGRLQLTPQTDPARIADDVVEAVRAGRRRVRHPKRALPLFGVADLPGRLVDACLAGVTPRRGVRASG